MTIREARVGAGGALLILAALGTLGQGGFGWVHEWWVWLILILDGGAMYRACIIDWQAAGAAWVQDGKAWVNTYELVRVKYSADGQNRVLQLEDAGGGSCPRSSSATWRRTRRCGIWSTTILHSIASGNCEVSPKTRKILKIPAGLGEQT